MQLPDIIVLYADQDNQFSFPKSDFQVNAPQYSFKIVEKPSKQITSTFLNQTTLKFPVLSRSMHAVNHMGPNFLMIQNNTHFTIVGCTAISNNVRCSRIFDLPNDERVYANIQFDGYFVIMTGSSTFDSASSCFVRIAAYDLFGQLAQNHSTLWKICPSQATLREHDDTLYVEILASDPADPPDLEFNKNYLYSMTVPSVFQLSNRTLRQTGLPSPICPTFVAWGFSRLN